LSALRKAIKPHRFQIAWNAWLDSQIQKASSDAQIGRSGIGLLVGGVIALILGLMNISSKSPSAVGMNLMMAVWFIFVGLWDTLAYRRRLKKTSSKGNQGQVTPTTSKINYQTPTTNLLALQEPTQAEPQLSAIEATTRKLDEIGSLKK